MPWLIAAILSLTTPAPADEVELPRTGVSPATTFWVLDTPTSGHWQRSVEKYYTLTWYEAENGSLAYDATEVSYEEMRQAEEYGEMYGG